MGNKELTEHIIKTVTAFKEIKLVYLFGSIARGEAGPLSDVDVAVYFAGLDKKQMVYIKLKLLAELSKRLKTDKVDVVVLNTLEEPELKYQIIHQGRLIYDEEPYRVLIEPRILIEYFDFKLLLSRYGLTKA